MKRERQVFEQVDHLRERGGVVAHPGIDEGLIEQGARIEQSIAQPRAVSQQMAHSDRAAGRLGVVKRSGARAQHAALAELRDEALDRIVQAELAVFHQQQHRAGGDQLGARIHAKNMIGSQRNLLLAIGPAGAVQIDQVAALQHRRRHAGQQLALDDLFHGGVQRREIKPRRAEREIAHRDDSSRNSIALRAPLAGRPFSWPRSSTRRILPEMVLGRSANSMRRIIL